jgi:hypothetical protein
MQSKLWTPSWAPGQFPDQVWQGPIAAEAKRGMELVNLRELGFLSGIMGGAGVHGTNVAADVVTQTADGRDLNQVWQDMLDMLNAANADRQALIRFLTFSVSNPVEQVAQSSSGVDFEEASEFGEPVGARLTPSYFNMGYTFKWYDLAGRYTWQYLADATTTMVDSVANAAVEAFWRKQMFEVLKTVFNPNNLTATINQNPYTVYKFYNNDGTTPPDYKNNTFTNTHQHYRTTGAGTLNAGDLDEMIDDFAAHGYSGDNGYRTVIMVHKTQGDVIRTFRSTANGGTGKYDFLPSQGQPGALINTTQQIIGQSQVANTLGGLNVIGSYGVALIVQDDWLPSTHVFGFVTGGENSLSNPVGIREHANAALRGLRLVKGRNPDYPLIDSFWNFGFGTGVRHRGAGMVMEVSANASYTVPAIYA